ncbi:MAG: methyltransferase domain-containing protein [Burkholderiaceae bacterium]|nr:methyltransferase domain-containing protein [Burkholderiaceae bacterium]
MIRAAFQGLARSLLAAARGAVGLSAPRITEDRRVLEQVILPAFAQRPAGQRVLFVGCAAYTKAYAGLFTAHDYWTIDPVARRRRYGAQRHIVDYLQSLDSHFADSYFDIIICNGVLGWGLNEAEQAEAAFAACYRHLREEGDLLLGWNDVAPRNRVPPNQVHALQRYEPCTFAPLQTSMLRVPGPNRHVFSFYRK